MLSPVIYAVQALAKTYESMNDKWRALGYQKAITSLKKHHRAITSFEVSKILCFEIIVFVTFAVFTTSNCHQVVAVGTGKNW